MSYRYLSPEISKTSEFLKESKLQFHSKANRRFFYILIISLIAYMLSLFAKCTHFNSYIRVFKEYII